MNRVFNTLLSLILLSSLSACEWIKENPDSGYSFKSTESPMGYVTPQEPEMRVMRSADATWVEPVDPANRAVPVMTKIEKEELKRQAMAEQARLAKLENDVERMQDDLSMIMPALQKIAENQQATMTKPAVVAPAGTVPNTVSAAPTQLVPTAGIAGGPVVMLPSASINALRVGEHADKTRLILDASQPIKYKYALDSIENSIVIRLPNTSWNTTPSQNINLSKVINGYTTVANSEGGTDLIVNLKSPVSVVTTMTAPENGAINHKIVFDLQPI